MDVSAPKMLNIFIFLEKKKLHCHLFFLMKWNVDLCTFITEKIKSDITEKMFFFFLSFKQFKIMHLQNIYDLKRKSEMLHRNYIHISANIKIYGIFWKLLMV